MYRHRPCYTTSLYCIPAHYTHSVIQRRPITRAMHVQLYSVSTNHKSRLRRSPKRRACSRRPRRRSPPGGAASRGGGHWGSLIHQCIYIYISTFGRGFNIYSSKIWCFATKGTALWSRFGYTYAICDQNKCCFHLHPQVDTSKLVLFLFFCRGACVVESLFDSRK